MAAAGVDQAVGLVGALLLPLGGDKKVRLNLEKALEHKWETGSGGLAQGERLQVVIVQAKESPVALNGGFGEIEVEERVVLEAGALDLQRREVEEALQDAESAVLASDFDGHEVLDLENKTLGPLNEQPLGADDLFFHEHDLAARRNEGAELPPGTAGTATRLGERSQNSLARFRAFHDHNIVDVERIEVLGLAAKESGAVADRGIDNGVFMNLGRDGLTAALEQVLVDAALLVEDFECRFQGQLRLRRCPHA